ncbi:AT-rich interactive domain containing protein 2 isoform X1 [Gracilaria domingensis]|nr:AT-rich interactive domain containing protein 2 isoform X1 [Gracilaria domingensis]
MNQNEGAKENVDKHPKVKLAKRDRSMEDIHDLLYEQCLAQGSTIVQQTVQNSTRNKMDDDPSLFQRASARKVDFLPIQEEWNFDSAGHTLEGNVPNADNMFLSKTTADHHSVMHSHSPQQLDGTEPNGTGLHLFPGNPRTHVNTQDEFTVNPCARRIDDIGASTSVPLQEREERISPCVESSALREGLGDQRTASQQLTKSLHADVKQHQRLRIDILSLDVVESPLQKDGRHTIICGRLPDNHPYAIAARGLGRYLISKRYSGVQICDSEAERRENFLKDWKAFHEELLGFIPKLPVIGGGELDIYSLVHEVLLLGGVINVVKKRAFRVVAQQLELPKSCTSAASVLKNAYEKLLFYYEEKLVHNRMPQDVTQKLDMKRMALEEKEKERRAAERLARMIASKKRNSDAYDMLIDVGDCTDLVENGCLDREDPRLKRIMLAASDRPRITLRYLDLIVDSDAEDLMLPELEDTPQDDGLFRIALHDVIQMDDHEQGT